MLDRVMPIPGDERDHTRLEKGRAKVVELFHDGVGIGREAFTEYADHCRPVRSGAQDPVSSRLESIWLGAAAELKRHALAATANESNIRLATAWRVAAAAASPP